MRTILKHIPLLLLLLTVINTSCRRPLDEELHLTAKIPIHIFWDTAHITAHNATVIAYREDGSLYQEKNFSSDPHDAHGEIELAVGTYTIVVFNEKRNQIDYIRMIGHEHLSTFEAYVSDAPVVYKSVGEAGSTTGQKMTAQPGMLAVWKGTFTVTPEMVTYSRDKQITKSTKSTLASSATAAAVNALTDIRPILKTTKVSLTAHIKGLHNAYMPSLVELRNMAQGYMFGTDKNTYAPVTVQFFMNNRKYDEGSTTDGTISQTIYTMGLPGDRTSVSDLPFPIWLHLAFQLVDNKTSVERLVNITPMIEIKQNVNVSVQINAMVHVEEKLPDVDPIGGGGGMTSDVIEWEGERVNIEL